jgi:aspartate aminotransferase/aminotransferase
MSGRSFIADHVRSIGESGIRRVFNLAASLTDPINLSIGEPDFGVPPEVRAAMIRAIEEGRNRYTVTRGIPELRQRIAAQLREEFDWEPDLFVTCGVSGGLLLALMACVNPGDEVIIPDPYFVSYKHLVKLVGGVPKTVSLYDDFQLHPERFAEAVTRKSKIIMIASPSNPTGVVFADRDLEALADLARQHDLLLISDEIYNQLTYDGPAPSPVPHAKDRTLLLRGYSKSYAMTGLRMGYAAGPAEVIGEMAKLQQYSFVCAPQPAQWGALAAMDTDVSQHVNDYRAKRDLVCRELEGSFEFIRPSGGFYVFPKAPARFASATVFVDEAIRNNVLIIPGNVFSERDSNFRISYAASDETIRKGCAVLRSIATAR